MHRSSSVRSKQSLRRTTSLGGCSMISSLTLITSDGMLQKWKSVDLIRLLRLLLKLWGSGAPQSADILMNKSKTTGLMRITFCIRSRWISLCNSTKTPSASLSRPPVGMIPSLARGGPSMISSNTSLTPPQLTDLEKTTLSHIIQRCVRPLRMGNQSSRSMGLVSQNSPRST